MLMIRSAMKLSAAAVAGLAVLLVAGCPGTAPLAQDSGQDAQNKDAAYEVLGQTVTADEFRNAGFDVQLASTSSDLAGAVNIGGSAPVPVTIAPSDIVPFDAIDVSAQEVFGPDMVRGGGLIRAHGGLAGRFVSDEPGANSDESGGTFRGRWYAADGTVIGVLRGEYQPVDPNSLPPGIAGGGVFHGTYLDNEGNFRGELRGRYGHRANGPGRFFGRWLDHDGRLIGVLGGHWTDDPETDGGTFQGRWAALNICSEADALPDGGIDQMTPAEADQLPNTLVLDESAIQSADQLDLGDVQTTDITDEPDLAIGDGTPPCIDPSKPFGFFRGWHAPASADDPNNPGPPHGVMRGHWRAANLQIHGDVLGRWRATQPPSPGGPHLLGEFRARYLDADGNIRGTLQGVYGVGPHGIGVFRGRYFNLDDEPLGVIVGRWDNAPGRPGGPLFGIWAGVDFPDPNAP